MKDAAPHQFAYPKVTPLPPRWAALAKLGDKPLPVLGKWRNLD